MAEKPREGADSPYPKIASFSRELLLATVAFAWLAVSELTRRMWARTLATGIVALQPQLVSLGAVLGGGPSAPTSALGAPLDVYVEIDVGMKRCGVPPGAAAVELAKMTCASAPLRFAGLQAYHGRAQHMRTMEERHAVIEAAAQHVLHTRRLLEEAGIACPIVTGAGSGTYMFEVESGAWDEIQPGSYAFMDADYARNEWAAPLPRFQHALFVLTTVMSRPSAQLAIVDAGLKASSVDSGMPAVWQRPGLDYTHASDEHGWVEGAGRAVPALGEKLLLVPGHCDPTINLYDWYVCVRKGIVADLWAITARGALT